MKYRGRSASASILTRTLENSAGRLRGLDEVTYLLYTILSTIYYVYTKLDYITLIWFLG